MFWVVGSRESFGRGHISSRVELKMLWGLNIINGSEVSNWE